MRLKEYINEAAGEPAGYHRKMETKKDYEKVIKKEESYLKDLNKKLQKVKSGGRIKVSALLAGSIPTTEKELEKEKKGSEERIKKWKKELYSGKLK